jgi:hypothetical protein
LCYVYYVLMYINGVVADGSAADRVPGWTCEMSCLPSRTVLYGVLYKQEVVLTTFFGKWDREQHGMRRGPVVDLRKGWTGCDEGAPPSSLPAALWSSIPSRCALCALPVKSGRSGRALSDAACAMRACI